MTEPLVSPQWLATHASDVCVLDIRSAVDGGGAAAYEQAHVPGAVHTDYVKDGWRAAKGMATGLLPDRAHLADLFARCGITPARHVVIVGAGTSPGDFSAAARVYWTLKVAGHRAQSILDGGMAAWLAAGLPVESGRRAPPTTAAYPVQFVDSLRADLASRRACSRQARCDFARHAFDELLRGPREEPAGKAPRPPAARRSPRPRARLRPGDAAAEAARRTRTPVRRCRRSRP